MKNIGMSILVAMMIASCVKKETPAEVNTTTETTVEKTVIVDTVAVPQPKDDNGTSVKVGSDGVEIKSDNGDKSTSVEIKK